MITYYVREYMLMNEKWKIRDIILEFLYIGITNIFNLNNYKTHQFFGSVRFKPNYSGWGNLQPNGLK